MVRVLVGTMVLGVLLGPFSSGAMAVPSGFALGRAHTCAIRDGAPWCWGLNGSGQVGDGSVVSRDVPVAVSGFGDAARMVSIAAGWNHTCAVSEEGALYCWGLNSDGQLGDGSVDNRTTPVVVPGFGSTPRRVRGVVAGRLHTCALTERGRVWCWGDNGFSQLGTYSSDSSAVPREVEALSGVIELAAGGGDHTCARRVDGSVACWGSNHMGQTGEVAAVDQTIVPRTVAGIDDAIGIGVGYSHSCALRRDGSVLCWGNNYGGQLGQGNFTNPPGNRRAPVPVTGLPVATGLALAGDSSCAVTQDTSLHCWGANTEGLCQSIGGVQHALPQQVLGLETPVRAAGFGYEHMCALGNDGVLACAGSYFDGRLGLGPDRSVFVQPQVVLCGWDQHPDWKPEYAEDIFRSALPWPVTTVSPARPSLVFLGDFDP